MPLPENRPYLEDEIRAYTEGWSEDSQVEPAYACDLIEKSELVSVEEVDTDIRAGILKSRRVALPYHVKRVNVHTDLLGEVPIEIKAVDPCGVIVGYLKVHIVTSLSGECVFT